MSRCSPMPPPDARRSRRPTRPCASLATVLLVAGLAAAGAPARGTVVPADPTVAPATAPGDDPLRLLREEVSRLRQEYEARLAALEQRIRDLEPAVAPPPPPPPPPPPAPAPTPRAEGAAAPRSGNFFNPAISLNGSFVAVGGHNPLEEEPGLALREAELAFQSVVDPYARADVYLALGEEGVEIEEGVVTFTALPRQVLAKVGRMRATFGKVNTLHLHSRPWIDTPLPILNLLGGEEGWIGSGVSVAKLLPLGDTFSELTVQAFRADHEGLWAAARRRDLAYNAHYKLFGDLSEASNLEVGLSYGWGPNGSDLDGEPAEDGDSAGGNAETHLAGLDLTYRWKPLRTSLYRGLVLRGEIYRSAREQPGETGRTSTVRALGWYSSAEYQMARRWTLGARLEAAERAVAAHLEDRGQALLLTFQPTDFSRLRGEFRRRRYAEGSTANELLLELQFSIGAHGAHPF